MKEIKVIGLDLAMNVFQVHGMDATGCKVVGKKLKRGEVLGPSPHLKTRWGSPAGTTGFLDSSRLTSGFVPRIPTDGCDSK